MDSNTHSTEPPAGPGGRLTALAVAVAELAAQDLGRLPDAVLAEEVLGLRRLLDGLEGQWLRGTGHRRWPGGRWGGAAPAVSTVSWLRNRLRLNTGAASGRVRTARALFRGPLAGAADALVGGVISPAHAKVLADGTHRLPAPVVVEAEPMLVGAAVGLDPPRLRLAVG
jgi:hypothetical protein